MKANRVWWGVAFITGLVLLATIGMVMSVISRGTGDSNSNDLWTQKDSWYTGFPSQPPSGDDEHGQIHRQRLLPVPDSHLNEAVALLEHVEVVEIDLPKARQMLDMPDLAPDTLLKAAVSEEARRHRFSATKAETLLGKTKAYLVRAVVLWEGTGGFDAYWKDSSLWIHHGCLGRRAVPMKRRPLVIFLEKKPVSVYNDLSMAE